MLGPLQIWNKQNSIIISLWIKVLSISHRKKLNLKPNVGFIQEP